MSDLKVSKREYEEMQRQISKLDALEAGGVDNWEWYDESLKDWRKENEIEELVDDVIANINDILGEADVDEPAGSGCGYSIVFDEDFMAKMLKKFMEDYHKLKIKD